MADSPPKSNPQNPIIRTAQKPKPITPTRGGGYIPSEPRRTEMPTDWSPYLPKRLKLRATAITIKAIKEFPVRSQIEELCKKVISDMTPHLCAMDADSAEDNMKGILRSLLIYNCDPIEEDKKCQLGKKIRASDEWLYLTLVCLADSKTAEEPERPQRAGGTGPIDSAQGADQPARPQPATATNGNEAAPLSGKDEKAKIRARDVVPVIDELNILTKEIYQRSDYEPSRKKYPHFLTFQATEMTPVSRRHGKLIEEVKLEVRQLCGRRPERKLAFQIVAAIHKKAWHTVATNWKDYGATARKAKSAAKV